MNLNNIKKYITPYEASAKLMVLPSDIINWINEGKLKAKKKNGKYIITLEDYQCFVRSFSNELLNKIGKYLWYSFEKIRPPIHKEVITRYRHKIQYILDRDEEAVQLLEKLHKKHEPHIDIFNDKRGYTACFIIYARVISLSYSIIILLRSSVPAESLILLRPFLEAILLAEYFMFSEVDNENQKQIRKWFEKDESPTASEVRNFLSDKLDLPINTMRNLHNRCSKPVHHTYKTIMESYRTISMSISKTGISENLAKRMGFDYHQSSKMLDIVSIISAFESLLLLALQVFLICFFSKGLLLNCDDSQLIKNEIDFYSLDGSKRRNIIFKRDNKRDKGKK